ncbi:MAG: hypothetical protein KDD58_16225, partial [Bdellovibrionales bacterium]|nr:hypothetical protein [Bdellovibrionales bacterium]
EVKHSRSGFKANISGSDYDFLVFVFAPSVVENGIVKPIAKRKIFVFPQSIVESTPKGKTQTNFNPKYIHDFEKYENGYSQILEALS